ncbi:hypothetical protein GW17_00042932 [Ensete ventricosum]|nr:hypothetical protein GW17_00042932 [Ensete ventricosum]
MLHAASGHLVHGRHLVGAVPVGDTHGGSVGATLLWAGHGRCPYGLAVGATPAARPRASTTPCGLAASGRCPYDPSHV